MAPSVENGQEAPRECPVCFESVSAAQRTLTCRHVFCQDCLAKMLVVAHGHGCVACPLCRHITVLIKEETLWADEEGHTGEAPLPFPLGHLQRAPGASAVGLWRGVNWVTRCLRRSSRQVGRQRVTVTNRISSQIFIISDQGRPMSEGGGAVDIAATEPAACRLTWADGFCLLMVAMFFTLGWLLMNHVWE